MRVTHIGTATLLLELEGLRLLTDPVFDAPGEKWRFGFGTSSVHQETPALTAEQVGAVDAVLLSHDQHGDNLDRAGREFTRRAPKVVTTVAGANCVGLAPMRSRLTGSAIPRRETEVVPVLAAVRPGVPSANYLRAILVALNCVAGTTLASATSIEFAVRHLQGELVWLCRSLEW